MTIIINSIKYVHFNLGCENFSVNPHSGLGLLQGILIHLQSKKIDYLTKSRVRFLSFFQTPDRFISFHRSLAPKKSPILMRLRGSTLLNLSLARPLTQLLRYPLANELIDPTDHHRHYSLTPLLFSFHLPLFFYFSDCGFFFFQINNSRGSSPSATLNARPPAGLEFV